MVQPDTVHADLADEQTYLDHAYRCLAAMRDHTARLADIEESAAQGTDSDAAKWHLKRRLASLDTDVDGLSFGRLDDEEDGVWYVGRRHVEDSRGDPVVVDWRAEISTPFYRATAVDPMGLQRRRRFLMTGRQVDDLFDEVFDDPDSVDAAHHGGIPDPLLAELERSRTGEMRDIVATIAAEQDLIIRAPLDTCLVVQGGPGTGKTAVGLHRAAFLLYEHRGQLDREGVLVVGPNPLFLRYIAQVLPSLGETAVRQTTLDRLLAGTNYRVRAAEAEPVARLKGDARLADVLAAAVRAARGTLDEPVAVATEWGTVTLQPDEVNPAIKEIDARDVPHNVGRNALRTQLVRLVRRDLTARRGEETAGAATLDADLRRNREWQRLLDRLWPTLSAPALVRRMLGSPTALRAAAAGLLGPDEQALLRRPSAKRVDDEAWTGPDLALLDEAQALITGPPTAYGHLVVDEAQDLSAMGFRALARRCPSRSLTVLGDLAQATGPAAQRAWDDVLALLGRPATASRVDLDLGYRVPAPIMEVANRLLADAAPDVVPCQSVRSDGAAPRLVGVPDDATLAATTRDIAGDLAVTWSSVGVVVPAALSPHLTGLPDNVTVVPPEQAKGLEFDAVVVVEPSLVAEDTDIARGLRLLYVALTRAVQELVVVHARPLPEPLVLVER